MVNISLTASMRSNLLSLQSIASQQDLVQNRLATGLKVSSAIDNPSSYYTAQSLNNRASDLTQLLDSMSQGIQTLKAVSETITSASKFLEQAKAVANQAMENTQPIVARVSSEADLQAALASDKRGLIVIDRDIVMSTNSNIVLKDGQSLVGAKYLDGTRMDSTLSFNNSGYSQSTITVGNNSIVSDLNIKYITDIRTSLNKEEASVINIIKKNNVLINNVSIDVDSSTDTISNTHGLFGIYASSSSYKMSGNININAAGKNTRAVLTNNMSTLDIQKNSVLNIKSSGGGGYGFQSYRESVVNIYDANVKIDSKDCGLYTHNNGVINLYGSSRLDVTSSTTAIFSNGTGSLNLNSSEVILSLAYSDSLFRNFGSLTAAVGAKIQTNDGLFQAQNNVYIPKVPNGNLLPVDFHKITEILPPQNLIAINNDNFDYDKSLQYNSILNQFDMIIKDSSYKGINLLLGQSLKVNFNEDRSSKLDITGVNASTNGLGLNDAAWKNQNNVEASISELDSAISDLRQYASEFGNYYSIVSNREEFTNNLVNVLTEGADKLTLADMNQESANMLALQTAQSLAINSLSLASQASQSILKLF